MWFSNSLLTTALPVGATSGKVHVTTLELYGLSGEAAISRIRYLLLAQRHCRVYTARAPGFLLRVFLTATTTVFDVVFEFLADHRPTRGRHQRQSPRNDA